MSSYIRDGQPAGLYTQGHTVIHALRAGGLRPLRYTQGHTVIHAPYGAGGLRPLRYEYGDGTLRRKNGEGN